jgi:hypothetical protein
MPGAAPNAAADAVAAVVDDHVVHTGLDQLDRRADAGKSGADDQGVVWCGHVRPPARG